MNAIGSKRREGEGDVISTVRNVHRVPGTYSWADDVDILVVAALGRTRERCSMESCGSWARVHSGANYPTGIRRSKLATAVFSSGYAAAGGTAATSAGTATARVLQTRS